MASRKAMAPPSSQASRLEGPAMRAQKYGAKSHPEPMVPVTTVRIKEVMPSSRRSVVATDLSLRCRAARHQIGNEISGWQPSGLGADQLAPQRFCREISGHRLAIDRLKGSAAEAVDQQRLIAGLQLGA